MSMEKISRALYKKRYKLLVVISTLLLITSLGIIANTYLSTGELFKKGVSLKGGITLTLPVTKSYNIAEIESAILADHPQADIAIRQVAEGGKAKALIIEAADIETEELRASIEKQGITMREGEYTIRSMGGSLSSQFFYQTIRALIYAFIAMAIVVYLTFRSIVPTTFIVVTVISDIITTLAIIDLLGVRLSMAGLAAFLMLIGYSVDTDILLTTKVLKRKEGDIYSRISDALKTGMMISIAALAASISGLVFSQSETISQIMLVITIGLAADIIYTWCQNASVLRWYLGEQDNE